jgi:hypothetical protein
MAKYCKCAGDFVNTLDIDEFAKKLKTFKGIAVESGVKNHNP